MATSPNFNWPEPDNTDLVRNGALAIRTAVNAIDTSLVDLKGGTTGQVLAKATNTDMDFTWATPSTGTSFSPNLCINGAFIINQRAYASGTSLASGAYGLDRWKSSTASTSLTFTANLNNTVVTISSGGSIEQVVERQNVPAGTYTLSWSGTATARVYNTGGTPPSYAASPITFTADGLANVEIEFTASGGTRTVSLVKFERGSSATTYSLAGNTFAGELAACQRYFWQTNAAAGNYTYLSPMGSAYSTAAAYVGFVLPATMRVAPTTLTHSGIALSDGATLFSSGTWTLETGSQTTTQALVNYSHGTASLTQYRPYFVQANNNSAAFVGLSAEL